MKFQILIFFLIIPFFSQGQILINGSVKDTNGIPIAYATIQQIEAKENSPGDSIRSLEYFATSLLYSSQSDAYGIFHFELDTTVDLDLKITNFGFKDTIFVLEKIPEGMVEIILQEDTTELIKSQNHPHRYKRRPSELTMGLDFFSKNFDEFSSLLGDENIERLNQVSWNITFGFAKNYGRLYTGLVYGISFHDEIIEDTLKIEVNQSLFEFQLGFKIVDSKRLLLMPQASAKLFRTRLINGFRGDKVALPNYLNDQDIDLRFLQPVADFGLTVGYKFIPKNALKNNYMIVGLHGGYPIKLRNSPRVNGLRTKLKTDKSIEIGKFTLGLFWRTHFH